MSLTYVHLSDIHFGQARSAELYVHDDVKACLLDDLVAFKAEAGIERMNGVIVTGDVAFSGKKREYDEAATWLDRLTQRIGCEKTDVLVVPGNHDIERDRISCLAALMVGAIVKGGSDKLESFLKDSTARELLYEKFHDYRAFAEGYGCPLAADGGVAVTRQIEIEPGRALRFVGLNSALLCTGHDGDEGKLLIGGRQRVLPRCEGHELVVLCHHPLESLQDRESAALYIGSRARVHIYGHMHRPSVRVESPIRDADLLTISAGAVVPPEAGGAYRYTYNVISFEWDAETAGLEVQIVPRTWNERETRFDADTSQFSSGRFRQVLRGPSTGKPSSEGPAQATGRDYGTAGVPRGARESTRRETAETAGRDAMVSSRGLLRLKFFRDLSAAQRQEVLIEVGILSSDWSIELTHTFERRLFDQALDAGLEGQLTSAVGVLLGGQETAERD